MLRRLAVVMVFVVFLTSGCALHGEFSAGAGKGMPYAASMSGGRGAGMDWPVDSNRVETAKTVRAARD